MSQFVPYIDGEKIPDASIRDIFRPPPDVPQTVSRSSLVIGARGVGKTSLFRFLKETHKGTALHVSLSTEFASVTKQTALGPLAFDCPEELERLVVGKSTALLALCLIDRLVKKTAVQATTSLWQYLMECIPSRLRTSHPNSPSDAISSLRRSTAAARIDDFDGIGILRPLPEFLCALGEEAQKGNGPLLLLFDRADAVSSPCLVPVIEVLDQSSSFVALVAIRPGYTGRALEELGKTLVPGDHYDVLHLGTSPRSEQWMAFVEDAVSAQIRVLGIPEERFISIRKDVRDWITYLSRDSLRTALELYSRYLSTTRDPESELRQAVQEAKESLIIATQPLVKFADFRELVAQAQEEVRTGGLRLAGPIQLEVKAQPKDLFDTSSQLHRFIEGSLRCGALSMPNGRRWVPGNHPLEAEVAPLLTWKEADGYISPKDAQVRTVSWNERQLRSSSGGSHKPQSVFVAYRMQSEESKEFRRQFETFISNHPHLSALHITDGHVAAGTPWAEKIRELIRSARAVIGDVTGMRTDVLFELGFAYGLRKVVVPVVSEPAKIRPLPGWLSATQMGHYGSRAGMVGVANSLATHLADPEYARVSRQPAPIPGLIVWLRSLPWNDAAYQQFKTTVEREGLSPEIFDGKLLDEGVLRRVASASLVVASLDGTDADAFVHYVCGGIVAQPKAGYGSKNLARKILLLEAPHRKDESYASDSLRRCPGIVQIITADDVIVETRRFCQTLNQWASSKRKKK